MHNDIILYHSQHAYSETCNCSYCVNKKGIIASLQKMGYRVFIDELRCDWDYFYPAQIHFDYAIKYQHKIYGEFMFEATKMPAKLVEFADTYFDYIICASKFLMQSWINSGTDAKYLIHAGLGLNTEVFNTDVCSKKLYPGKFKFLSVGAWQPAGWQDRKGFEVLIRLFKELFKDNKQVMLIIKTNEAAKQVLSTDNIKIIRDSISEYDIADLYRSCAKEGAYIHLHKGEGFGRTLLEALHCGCKIGATGHSGVLDFLNDKNATLFKYKLIETEVYLDSFYKDKRLPMFAQVDEDDVRRWMINVVKQKSTNPNFATRKEHSWDRVVQDLVKQILERL